MHYNSVGNYANLFADIIADVQGDDPTTTDNMVAGFKQAIKDWRDYHAKQIVEFDRMEKMIDGEIKDQIGFH